MYQLTDDKKIIFFNHFFYSVLSGQVLEVVKGMKEKHSFF